MPGTIRPPQGSSPQVQPDSGLARAATALSSPSILVTTDDTLMPRVCPNCGVMYSSDVKVCPRDGTALSESDVLRDEVVGKTLSQTYNVIRVIGEGGMGRVYEARHTRITSKRFAVKMLHPEFARQPQVISRFQREAEAAAAIASPHVITVFDVGRTDDGRPYLVGEFLEGKEFADYLSEVGKLPIGPAVRIVRQICKALIAAHAKGVVHRDMKPENVFLTGNLTQPTAKVIDFGISKIDDAPGTALTKTGMIMGTPAYMAPEQAKGERVDHRADIYAVGAILYCALTGSRPFDRGDPTATLTAVLTEDPPRPRSLEPSIPEPLEMIIQRSMAKEPQERYQSMEELDIDLAPYDPGDAEDALLRDPGPMGLLAAPTTTRAAKTIQTRQAQEVTMARPLIVLLSGLGLFWVAGSVITLITAIIRLSRGGGPADNLTGSEAFLLTLAITLALATPAILAFVHVRRAIWNNSMKAVALAEKLRRPVVVGLCGYGFASLLVRLIEAVILRRAAGAAWPVWDLLFFVITAVGAIGAHLLLKAERR